MANAIRSLMALLALMLSTACSMDTMIQNMTSEEDRAMTQAFIDHIRARDMAALEAMIDPGLWKESVAPLEQAATMYPEGGGETRIMSYSMNSDGSAIARGRARTSFSSPPTNGCGRRPKS